MVYTVALPYPVAKRPLGIAGTAALSLAVVALGIRALDTSGDPLAFARVVISAIAIAAFFFFRRYSLVKGIVAALAIEVVSGTTLFALVDMPFVNHVAPQLARATVMVLAKLAQ